MKKFYIITLILLHSMVLMSGEHDKKMSKSQHQEREKQLAYYGEEFFLAMYKEENLNNSWKKRREVLQESEQVGLKAFDIRLAALEYANEVAHDIEYADAWRKKAYEVAQSIFNYSQELQDEAIKRDQEPTIATDLNDSDDETVGRSIQ